MPFHMPTGLAVGLGLESAPERLFVPKPLVPTTSTVGTLGFPVPRDNTRDLGGHIRPVTYDSRFISVNRETPDGLDDARNNLCINYLCMHFCRQPVQMLAPKIFFA